MKLITSLLGVFALGFVIPVLAQEESPTTTTEEKASTTVEETPAPTPSPTAETKATATITTTAPTAAPAAAEKKEQPAAEKKASPIAAASPSAAPTTGKKMNVQAALKDNENRWEAAIGKHDIATVEAMVANDFIGVSSKAKVVNRRALLAEMKSDKDTYSSTKVEKLDVHAYGSGTAVVVGTAREKGTGKDGKAFDRTFRFTDTWVERNGQWQCVASQVMKIKG
jgi:ketosteroid isomerase-like protein